MVLGNLESILKYKHTILLDFGGRLLLALGNPAELLFANIKVFLELATFFEEAIHVFQGFGELLPTLVFC